MLTGGYGGWWFDMWGGWFSDPRLMAVLERTQELGQQALQHDLPAMKPQVCVVVDEELPFLDATCGALAAAIMQNRYPLGRSGAPYELYLRSDLGALQAGDYRAVWLLGPADLTAGEQAILEKWRAAGVSILWTRPALTTFQRPDGTQESFEGKIAWSPAELRRIWQASGVHIYLDTDDVLCAGRGWLSVHTVAGGSRTVRLPFAARIEDAFEPAILAESAESLTLNLPPNSTTLLRLAPSN